MAERGIASSLVRFAPGGPRWPAAVQAGIAMFLPITIGTALGAPQLGLLAGTGAFAAMYGGGISRLDRVRALPFVVIALILSAGLGVLGSGSHATALIVVLISGILSSILSAGYNVGAPGAFMFTLVTGIGVQLAAPHSSGGAGLPGWEVISLVAAGAILAYLVVIAPLIVPRIRRAQPTRTPVAGIFGRFGFDDNSYLATVRMVVAVVLGTLVGIGIDSHRGYWIVCTAMAILSVGHSRRLTLERGTHRVLGTLLGAGVFLLLALMQPHGFVLAIILGIFQGVTQLVISRHYGLALTLITPLALLIAGNSHVNAEAVAFERVLDTVIGAIIAAGVLLVTVPRPRRRSSEAPVEPA
ncbi:FUSC family protein [Mycetocola lacteus]|uniref:FUSC family protein n=1 Tax=Mycetocola lacteus TaxID=76637 RepID=A0A3L7AUE2_9MICO|nr:FUSC family protein [Mycetocola lacteus]RLP83150.1 FUSC family protein [Mycetocola lacteus]